MSEVPLCNPVNVRVKASPGFLIWRDQIMLRHSEAMVGNNIVGAWAGPTDVLADDWWSIRYRLSSSTECERLVR